MCNRLPRSATPLSGRVGKKEKHTLGLDISLNRSAADITHEALLHAELWGDSFNAASSVAGVLASTNSKQRPQSAQHFQMRGPAPMWRLS
jgi:hypothetical protein